MAKIADGVLKNWQNGETVTAAEYYQEREMLRVGLNDVDTKAENATMNIQILSEQQGIFETDLQNIKDVTIPALQTNKADKTSVYTKQEMDTSLGLKADKSSVYTKTEADGRYVLSGTVDSVWKNVTFANNYRNWGGTYPPVQYRIMANGDIQLRGALCSVGTLEPAVMFNLPAEARPAYDYNVGATDNKWNRVNIAIRTTGDVNIPNNGATYDVDTAYINLGLITIPKN